MKCPPFVTLAATLLLAIHPASLRGEGTAAATAPAEETITRHRVARDTGETVEYLIYEPSAVVPSEKRALVIFLYGAGGSLKGYNIKREPYAQLRAEIAKRGWYLLVPDLGPRHFMNDAAKANLDAVVDRVLTDREIPRTRVHVMGTSMGGGSSLAYAIHRRDMIRSVCAIMPMTDFAVWIAENPKYALPLKEAYGGTPETQPEAYNRNSARKNVDAFEHIPVMLIHGDADRTVEASHSRALADLLTAREFKCTHIPVEGLAHKDEIVAEHQQAIVDIFESAME